MRLGLSQDQQQVPTRSASDIMPPPTAAPATKEIPYDYVAKFTLKGERGNRVQDVINISIEAWPATRGRQHPPTGRTQ